MRAGRTSHGGRGVPPATAVTYVGHATVLIEMDGVRLLTDPLLRWRLGPILRYQVPPDIDAIRTVDAVLVSHAHIDHLDLRSLRRLDRSATLVVPRGSGRTVRRLGYARVEELDVDGTARIGPLTVAATPAHHPVKRYPTSPLSTAVGYLVRGSRVVYFAGDTGIFQGMEGIGPYVDVALLPISGWGLTLPQDHLNPGTAAEALRLLRPHIAVPVHWGTYFAPGVPTVMRRRDARPSEEFARRAAALAPHVCVRILEPGETLRLEGRPQ